jgi:hypothetical protein
MEPLKVIDGRFTRNQFALMRSRRLVFSIIPGASQRPDGLQQARVVVEGSLPQTLRRSKRRKK